MLRMHIPKQAVANKMQAEGLDPAILDMDPEKPLPKKQRATGPPLKDDPTYALFFKMLKIGMPKPAVANKMIKDGFDPAILDLDPDQPVPPEFSKAKSNKSQVATQGYGHG